MTRLYIVAIILIHCLFQLRHLACKRPCVGRNVIPNCFKGSSSNSDCPKQRCRPRKLRPPKKKPGKYCKHPPQPIPIDSCSSKSGSELSSCKEEKNHYPYDTNYPHWKFSSVPMGPPDFGWFPFYFTTGNDGAIAYQFFTFQATQPVQVTITDCFCSGDMFAVATFLDGASISLTLATSCSFPSDPSTCNNYENSPFACANTIDFCSTSFLLSTPGFYNLTIYTAYSPYLAGTGFITMQAVCANLFDNPCCLATGNCNNTIANGYMP